MSDPELIYSSHVFCCTNLRPEGAKRGSCAAKGSEKLRNYMKARAKELGLEPKVRINSAGCLERCELGPALVIYPEGVWYTFTSQEDIDEILQTHVIDGGRVERLMLMPDQTEPRSEARSVAPA
ncbi:(2Fe-2S) ferredoxin domain-containing protein [Skermanella mucosa]|uniref:(2Fe-2S) ferredoxin domain-containing protein n=1 Tax=Skermanella mucosa TaxID=1789672 RepID=UPI00192AE7A2|nr:(2Fe-2S) ferredoxin domain-containing protein [Skermanella mucosa]UEM21009.1 (2Fe-2S) ferredoxin domain-containing protein [Skermanella mucosa]